MKLVLVCVFSLLFVLQSQAQDAALAINGQMVNNVVSQGTTAAYGQEKARRCSWRRPHNCMQAIAAGLQLYQLIQGLRAAGAARSAIGGFDFPEVVTDIPNLCVAGQTNCNSDKIDTVLDESGYTKAIQTGKPEDYDKALENMNAKMLAQQQILADKGYKVDPDTGIVTTPDGKTFNAKDLKMDLPESYQNLAQSKMESLSTALKKAFGGSSRSLASSKGKGSQGFGGGLSSKTLILEDGMNTKASARLAKLKKKRAADREKFLSSLGKSGGVGVAGDDIFKMLQRRYTTKSRAGEFLSR